MAKRPAVTAMYRGRRLPVFIQTARGVRAATARDAKTIRAAFRLNPSGYPFSGATWRPVVVLPDGTKARPFRFGPITRKDRTKKGRARWRRKLEACTRLAKVPRKLTHYRTKKQAMRALLDANPDLEAVLEGDNSRDAPGVDVIRSYLGRDRQHRWTLREAIRQLLPYAGSSWQSIQGVLTIIEEALANNGDWPHGGRVQMPHEGAAPEWQAEGEALEAAKACARGRGRRRKLEEAPF